MIKMKSNKERDEIESGKSGSFDSNDLVFVIAGIVALIVMSYVIYKVGS